MAIAVYTESDGLPHPVRLDRPHGGALLDETAIFFALRPRAEVASRIGQVFEGLWDEGVAP